MTFNKARTSCPRLRPGFRTKIAPESERNLKRRIKKGGNSRLRPCATDSLGTAYAFEPS